MNTSVLSSIPLFLRDQNVWKRALDPRITLLTDSNYKSLRIAAASHKWSIENHPPGNVELDVGILALIDIGQGILERGAWTAPSWRIEQYLATKFEENLGWSLEMMDERSGHLGYTSESIDTDRAFNMALVTARWANETNQPANWNEWASGESWQEGSQAEEAYFNNVLAPALGFPLLDFLILQRPLASLGLDEDDYYDQRADFTLDTGRGDIRLVIEIDGEQHHGAEQRDLDRNRDRELQQKGWDVFRIPVRELSNTESLKNQLTSYVRRKSGDTGDRWDPDFLSEPRSLELMTCVWGATVTSRIQFLLLEALRSGVLNWDEPSLVSIIDHDTNIGEEAIADFLDWFSRLRLMHDLSPHPEIKHIGPKGFENADLTMDISVTAPYLPKHDEAFPIAWSRPANQPAPSPKRKFSDRGFLKKEPDKYLLESFVQDFLRKRELREGQYEILSRILTGKDVVGLLPTGGGKSLTYQLSSLLLGGLTIYVSPLKSLLQDQRERLYDLGIDLLEEISSAVPTDRRQLANLRLASGELRFLLIAPERFLIQGFREQLDHFRANYSDVCQVVIDECHCVSEWGHDFRPAYLSVSRIVKDRTNRLGVSAPLVALTGTASSIVLADVQRELGVTDPVAVIRAKNMDRPEIELSCQRTSQSNKPQVIENLVRGFVEGPADTKDGLLIFCRFRGGLQGVVGIVSKLKSVALDNEVRMYTGEEPRWRQLRDFAIRFNPDNPTVSEISHHIPDWVVSVNGRRNWELTKAKTQKDFISGLDGNFRVLVATHAFGMGIDKPSIRQIVHYMTPPSPEAYYQEVGRAGRDGKPSKAILLFSDEEATLTDQLLSPETDIAQVRNQYEEFQRRNRYGGGDFIRTFYFHQNSFSGPESEVNAILLVIRDIREKLDESESLLFRYIPDSSNYNTAVGQEGLIEGDLEYAIVRLIILGVVNDYTKDYNAKTFSLTIEPEWEDLRSNPTHLSEYFTEKFRSFARRYQVRIADSKAGIIQSAEMIDDIEAAAAKALVDYVYDQVERNRRQASRQMLEMAREAPENPEGFKEKLLLYLQVSEKFTKDLEEFVIRKGPSEWTDIVAPVQSPDEIKELHGATQRVLESFPTNPGLLAISAITRLSPSENEIKRSEEDFRAALKYILELADTSEAKNLGISVVEYCENANEDMLFHMQSVFSDWLDGIGEEPEAYRMFSHVKPMRDFWLKEIIQETLERIPKPTEI